MIYVICVHACMHASIHPSMHTYISIHTYLYIQHTYLYIHTYLSIYLPTYLPIYKHICNIMISWWSWPGLSEGLPALPFEATQLGGSTPSGPVVAKVGQCSLIVTPNGEKGNLWWFLNVFLGFYILFVARAAIWCGWKFELVWSGGSFLNSAWANRAVRISKQAIHHPSSAFGWEGSASVPGHGSWSEVVQPKDKVVPFWTTLL